MDDKLYKKINEMSPDELINIIDNSNMYSAEAVELANYRLSYLTTPMNDKTDTTPPKSNEIYENKSTVKTAIQKNGIFNAYAKMFKNYANFKGRSSRGDFWYAGLMNGIIMLLFYVIVIPPLISMLDAVIIGNGNSGTPLQIASLLVGGILYIVWLFASLIPSLALSVRRLHDIGKSGWWYFISCVPIVGAIILLVYMATKSNDTTNEYGENPLISKEKVSTKGVKIGFISLIVLAVLSIVGACFSGASFTNTSSHAEGNIEFVDDNGDVILDKYDIVSAEAQYNEIQGWYIELKLNKQGQERFADATERLATYTDHIGSMGIFIDNELITSSAVNEKIDSDIVSITGNFTKEHAEVLANQIMYADFTFGDEYNDGLDEESEAEYENSRTDFVDYQPSSNKLVIGITEFEPMNYYENGELVGFDTELAKAVCNELGLVPEFKLIDWDSKIEDLNSGNIDCVWNGVSETEEMRNMASMSRTYLQYKCLMVVKTENLGEAWWYNSDGRTVSAMSGTDCEDAALYDSRFEKINFIGTPTLKDALNLVVSGKSDIAIIECTELKELKENYPELSVQSGVAFNVQNYAVALKKGNAELTNLISETIRKFQEDGTILKIAKKYDIEDMVLNTY